MSSALGRLSATAGAAQSRLQRRLGFDGHFEMADRRKGSDRLAFVLSGYKPYLWPFSLERVAHHTPDDVDVCVVSSGHFSPGLERIAAQNGWSYGWSRSPRLALVQNMAIERHPDASWIYKLDEDMLIADGYFEAMLDGYRRVEAEEEYAVGFCSPTVNLNGFSYVDFLAVMGLEDEYRAEFGPLTRAGEGIPAHGDERAAGFIWRNSVPLDEVAARFASRPFAYSTVPHRFSIGAILLERAFWADIGGFRAPLKPPGIGIDERDLCRECVERSRVMAVLGNVFAGHYAFAPQEAAMKARIAELSPGLAPGGVAVH